MNKEKKISVNNPFRKIFTSLSSFFKRLKNGFKNNIRKPKGRIISISLLACLIAGFSFSVYEFVDFYQVDQRYMCKDVMDYVDIIQEKGEYDPIFDQYALKETVSDELALTYHASDNLHKTINYYFNYELYDGTTTAIAYYINYKTQITTTFKDNHFSTTGLASFSLMSNLQSDGSIARYLYTYSDDEGNVTTLLPGDEKFDYASFKAVEQFNITVSAFDASLVRIGYSNMAFIPLSNTIVNNITFIQFGFFGWFFGLFLFGFAMLGLMVVCIYSCVPNAVFNRFQKRRLALNNGEEENEVEIIEWNSPLPNNAIKVKPFFKEGWLRIIAIFVIIAANIGLYFTLAKFMGFIFSDPLTPFYSSIAEVSKFISPISKILIIFLALNLMKSKKNYLASFFKYLLLGMAFYCVELVFILDLNISLASLLYDLLSSFLFKYLPGNIFFGLACYALMMHFLLSEPKFVKAKEHGTLKKVCFRLCAILPLLYIVAGTIVNFSVKDNSSALPFYVFILFDTRVFFISLFAILFIVSSFISDLLIKKKYGTKNFKDYQNLPQYQWIKNCTVAGIIAVFCVIDFLVGYYYGSTNISKVLGFGSFTYIFVLIPFVLLFKPQPNRKKYLDIGYTILYAAGYSLSYILIISIFLS